MKLLHCPVTLAFTSVLLVTALVIDKDKTLQLRSPCVDDCNSEAVVVKRHGKIDGDPEPDLGNAHAKRYGYIAEPPPRVIKGDQKRQLATGRENENAIGKRDEDISARGESLFSGVTGSIRTRYKRLVESGDHGPVPPKKGGHKRLVKSNGSPPIDTGHKHNKRDGRVTHEGALPIEPNKHNKRGGTHESEPPLLTCIDAPCLNKHNKRHGSLAPAPPLPGPPSIQRLKKKNTENEKIKVTHEGEPPLSGCLDCKTKNTENEKRKVESPGSPPFSGCIDCTNGKHNKRLVTSPGTPPTIDSDNGKKPATRKGH
ncbi:hypothetical protein HYALB_00005131 [Hymenoscyphus albidus]|uniref:Secreted protein n=1 Tax=Hymenoscyphus albidus TaxID=595503 RepID=A0A9N9QBJ5_9HELO|nr:hypothetical protein HYALB_00005131 [Hymenoscyphus albidus]